MCTRIDPIRCAEWDSRHIQKPILNSLFPHAKISYQQWMECMVKSADSSDRDFARRMSWDPPALDLVKSGKLKLASLYYGGKLRTIKELKEFMK